MINYKKIQMFISSRMNNNKEKMLMRYEFLFISATPEESPTDNGKAKKKNCKQNREMQ